MQSLEIPVVTQSRASMDYRPDNSQWIVGDSTILAHAVGITAFKDVSTLYLGLITPFPYNKTKTMELTVHLCTYTLN